MGQLSQLTNVVLALESKTHIHQSTLQLEQDSYLTGMKI
jgi:hypothetical protein